MLNAAVVTAGAAVFLAVLSLAVRDNPRLRHHLATTPIVLVCGVAGAVALTVALMIVAVLVAALLVGATITAWFPLDLSLG